VRKRGERAEVGGGGMAEAAGGDGGGKGGNGAERGVGRRGGRGGTRGRRRRGEVEKGGRWEVEVENCAGGGGIERGEGGEL